MTSVSYPGLDTGLPVVYIDTPEAQPITSKEIWMEGVNLLIFNADGSLDYEGSTQMKGRGNSTWTQFPKKPYALKLDKKAKILGMPSHKRWCLLANWMDRTLIRNAVAFEISRRTELAWTPNGFFVELVLNGEKRSALIRLIRAQCRKVSEPKLAERLTSEAEANNVTSEEIISEILNQIEVP